MTLPRDLPALPRAAEPDLRLPAPVRVVLGLAGSLLLGFLALLLVGSSVWPGETGDSPLAVRESVVLATLGTVAAAGSLACFAGALRASATTVVAAALLGAIAALGMLVMLHVVW